MLHGMTSDPSSAALAVSPDDILAAAARIAPYIHKTPLLTSRSLSKACGCELRLKGEHLQRGGSFKLRGALNHLLSLTPAERARGVVAFSSGNHAQGVALAAQMLGLSATIVMPSDAPAVKLQATAEYGGEIVLYDRAREDREAIARALCEKRGATLIPPFDDPRVIAGQGTIGLELLEQWPELQVALIPIGGGGLCSGIATALKAGGRAVRVIGVEPEAADDARQSLRADRIVRIAQPKTLADGVATQAVGRHTFPILRAFVDDIATVREDEILPALELILTRTKQVVEPTGALATAAALSGRLDADIRGKKVVSLLCGGNLDLRLLRELC
jgi:threonine dehydratase